MANLLNSPEDFTTGWTKILKAAVDGNATTAPDGTLTADRLKDDSSGGTGFSILEQPYTSFETTTEYCFGVFTKQDGLDWIRMVIVALTTPADGGGYFDIGTGAEGTIDAQFSGAGVIDTEIDGWYRTYISFITGASDTAGQVRLYVAEADGDAQVTTVDGSSSIFIWGASLNKGPTPDPYIAQSGWRFPVGHYRPSFDITSEVTRTITRDATQKW